MLLRTPACTALLCLMIMSAAGARDADPDRRLSAPPRRYLSGVFIMKLKGSAPNPRGSTRFGAPALDAILDRIGAHERRPLFPLAPYPEAYALGIDREDRYRGFDRVYVITYRGPYDPLWAAGELTRTGAVEFAEPYYTFDLAYTPNDPRIDDQDWLAIVQGRQAWDVTTGDSTIAIGIVDTGIDWEHEDLTAAIKINAGEDGTDGEGKEKRSNGKDDDGNGLIDDYRGWDFVGNPKTVEAWQNKEFAPDNDPSPHLNASENYGGYHGTLVAGCAGALPDNGKGIAGAGFRVKLIPVKCAADSIGSRTVVTGYDGIRYAADMGARVINCSWAGPGDAATLQALQTVVDYAYAKGALVVAASGNFSTNNDLAPTFPANLDHVLSVGATTAADSAAGFSQYGVTVDVWAPGVDVLTTLPGNEYATTANGEPISGTSYSAPIVSGIAALIFSLHPGWTPDQVAMQLRVTGDRVKPPAPEFTPYFFRRANALRALTLNTTLSEGNPAGIPGVAIESYRINGRTLDTINDRSETATIQLTLKNFLAPVKNLKIEAIPNQTLELAETLTIESLATLQSTTQELRVRIAGDASVLFSEGKLQLVLKLTSDSYEEYAAIRIPVYLPGWHQQIDPLLSNPFSTYIGEGIAAVKPNVAWTLSNLISGTQRPVFARTLDGVTWSPFKPITSDAISLHSFTALDELHAWGGSSARSGETMIFRTSDGGESWPRSSVASITPFVNAIHFFDTLNGIIVGDPLDGKYGIGVTTDGGASWSAIDAPPIPGHKDEAGWTGSFAAQGENLWFGSNNNRIYYSTDRGRSWQIGVTQSVNSFGIAFANAVDGLAIFVRRSSGVGTEAVMASHDGGRTWSEATLPFAEARPQSITFVPGSTRAFLATQNGVYETTDFGMNWKRMAMPPTVMQGMLLSATTDGSGRLGAYGTNIYSQLMTYRDSSITLSTPSLDPLSSSRATLFQNMPNPFSTLTTIAFELRSAAHVRLTLHDALGLQIATLIETRMDAGSRTVTLDASRLPAGSYYYTLDADGERLSRRMLIMK